MDLRQGRILQTNLGRLTRLDLVRLSVPVRGPYAPRSQYFTGGPISPTLVLCSCGSCNPSLRNWNGAGERLAMIVLRLSIPGGPLLGDDRLRSWWQEFGLAATSNQFVTLPKAIMDAPFSSQVHSLGIGTWFPLIGLIKSFGFGVSAKLPPDSAWARIQEPI